MRSKVFIGQQLRFWRLAIPTAVLALCVYAVAEMRYPLSRVADLVLWLSRVDPLLLIAHMRAAMAIPDWIWLPLVVMLITVFMGRVFCGWFCPVGGLLNFVHYSRRLFAQGRAAKAPAKLSSPPKQAKYWWLAFIIVLAIAGLGIATIITPLTLLSHEITRLYQGQFPWLLTVAVVTGIIFYPRFWCANICPTGIIFSLVAGLRRKKMRATDECVNCGSCQTVCLVRAVDTGPGGVGDECLVCGRCWSACQRQAIGWSNQKQSPASGNMQTRRGFLLAGTAVLAGGLFNVSGKRLFAGPATESSVLRPPGAVPESDFLARCNRCGRCVKVCPTGGLVPMPFSSGLTSYETPELIPRKGSCDLCMLCPTVCPTGALRPIKAADVKIGVARLDEQSCLAWAQGKACLICKERCPANAITIDDGLRPYVDPQNCIGCGACENACPLEEAAVKVIPCR